MDYLVKSNPAMTKLITMTKKCRILVLKVSCLTHVYLSVCC